METFDSILTRLTKLVCLVLGVYLIYHESQTGLDRPYLIAAGVGLIGPQFASTVDKALSLGNEILAMRAEKKKEVEEGKKTKGGGAQP